MFIKLHIIAFLLCESAFLVFCYNSFDNNDLSTYLIKGKWQTVMNTTA